MNDLVDNPLVRPVPQVKHIIQIGNNKLELVQSLLLRFLDTTLVRLLLYSSKTWPLKLEDL